MRELQLVRAMKKRMDKNEGQRTVLSGEDYRPLGDGGICCVMPVNYFSSELNRCGSLRCFIVAHDSNTRLGFAVIKSSSFAKEVEVGCLKLRRSVPFVPQPSFSLFPVGDGGTKILANPWLQNLEPT